MLHDCVKENLNGDNSSQGKQPGWLWVEHALNKQSHGFRVARCTSVCSAPAGSGYAGVKPCLSCVETVTPERQLCYCECAWSV